MSVNTKSALYRRILTYAAPYKKRIILSIFASFIVAGVDGAMAKLVQPFVDELIVAGNRSMVELVPFVVITLSVLKGVGRYVQGYFINTAGFLAIMDLRNDVFKHTLSLSMRFHSGTPSGSIMSCILNDIGLLKHAIAETLVNALKEGVTLLVLIGVAFYTDWQMALIAFSVLPLAILPASFIAKKIKKYVRKTQDATAILTIALEQAFSGIKVIKAFGTENTVGEDFVDKNLTCYRLGRKGLRLDGATSPVVEIMTSLGVAGVLYMGMTRVMDGAMTQGELFSIVAAIVMMFAPVKRLVKVNNVFQSAMGAAERVFIFQKQFPDIVEKMDAVDLENVRGSINFDSVSFAYDSSDTNYVLEDINLKVEPGEVVALVGPSGAGKTTLAGLLCRFYDPNIGKIALDGVDLRDVSAKSLHSNVTMVDQEAFLFNDSIARNIGYGRNASENEIREAARQSYAEDFIQKLPEGYDTSIGDRGVRLSGGQRQRISIARAICQDAPVLILDEATSALDTESEAIVQEAMKNLMKGRTTIVIAHRLSTIMNADRIVVMDNGRISEIGTHDQLLAKGGLYRKLYDMQFKDAE